MPVDFGEAMRFRTEKEGPKNRHYLLILVIVLVIVFVVFIFLVNYYGAPLGSPTAEAPPVNPFAGEPQEAPSVGGSTPSQTEPELGAPPPLPTL